MKKEALRVSTTIPAAPTTLYLAWLSSEQHSAMTGATAKIDPTVGATFTTLNGYISGKLIILDLGRRISMSWRTTEFPREAPDSRVEVHFEALGASTRLTVLHMDIPEGQGEHYRAVWNDKYFAPMRTFFSKYLPDPRKPPPPRLPPPPEEVEEELEEEPAKKVGKGVKVPPSSKKMVAKPVPAPKGKAPAKGPAPKPSVPKGAKAPPSKAKAVPTKKPAPKTAAKKPAAKKPPAKPAKKKK